MKYSFIAPLDVIQKVESVVGELPYRLLLGQYIINDPEYLQFAIRSHALGSFVMIDNGAAEQEPVDFEHLLSLVGTGYDEMIIPDAIGDRKETFRLFSFYASAVPATKRMIVPQGNTLAEWKASLRDFTKQTQFATIGIPKHLDRIHNGRLMALQYIQQRQLHKKYNVHMLGAFKNPEIEAMEAALQFPWIRGFDTAAPLAYAQAGKPLGCGVHHSVDWDVKDYESIAEATGKNVIDMIFACNPSMVRPKYEEEDVPETTEELAQAIADETGAPVEEVLKVVEETNAYNIPDANAIN